MVIAISAWPTVFSGVVLCVFLAILYSNQRVSTRRKKHKATHPSMSNTDFLGKLNVEDRHHEMCLDIRKAVAQVIKVPIETVRPSESDVHLAELGLTFEDLMLALETMGPYDIDFVAAHKLAFGDKNKDLSFYGNTLGDLIRFILDHLEIFNEGKVKGSDTFFSNFFQGNNLCGI